MNCGTVVDFPILDRSISVCRVGLERMGRLQALEIEDEVAREKGERKESEWTNISSGRLAGSCRLG